MPLNLLHCNQNPQNQDNRASYNYYSIVNYHNLMGLKHHSDFYLNLGLSVMFPYQVSQYQIMRFFLSILGVCLSALTVSAQCDGDHQISVYNYEFSPAELTIAAGESVSFTNYGGWHNVNGETNSLTGESFNNPEDFSLPTNYGWWIFGNCMGTVTFDVPGTYHYDCSIGDHAPQGMVGTIIVEGDDPTTTVVDVIVNSDVHNLLEAAVGAAGLGEALSGDGPFTVFAPTDDAFIALAAALDATAEDLLALDGLADILLYHVVGAQVLSTDLTDGATATTLNGADVEVSFDCEGNIFINDAQVTVADIVTDNGVVHVIDAVLLPPTPENACADGDCCGEGTVWDAELGQCVVEDDGCPADQDGDLFISIGDILSILVYFGHDCN